MPICWHLPGWHKAFLARDPVVDLPVDREEDHLEVVEVVVAAAKEDSHPWAHQVLLEVEES